MSGFIGVHVGAGNHSERSEEKYLKVCRKACEEGTLVLKRGGKALEAVTAATNVLENSPLTNAGLGSNLTWDGLVECDAMVMDGLTLHYGAVGAVPGIQNPVNLARHLCEQQSFKDHQFGRVKPSFMTLAPLETVGAVGVDAYGNVAASCSSGGIVLKTPGRVGQAAMYGCGCWAENGPTSVAASTTGCGEHLIRTMLGLEAARSVQSAHCPAIGLHHVMKNKFLESPFLRDVDEKLAGVILIKCSPEEEGEFLWAHTTQTMCTGYMSTTDKRPKSRMSRMTAGVVAGSKAVVEGIHFKWHKNS